MTNYYPISPARRRASAAGIGRSLTSPWMLRLVRTACIAALGLVVLFTPELGHERHLVGWLVILGFAPAALLMDVLISEARLFGLHTTFDLAGLAIASYLLPGVWHPALMMGAVVLGMGVPAYSLRGGVAYLLLPLGFGLAMGWIAESHLVTNSFLPLLAVFAAVPIVLVYAMAERRRVQAQADRSEVFEGLSQLAGSVGQDFNNMLMAIQGNAELLGLKLEPQHAGRTHLAELNAASHRAAVLSAQLLAFSGDIPSGREQLNMREEILGLLGMLRGLVPHTVEFRPNIDRDLPLVDADRAQLQQIIFNIVMYAASHREGEKATVQINVRCARFRTGEQVLIQVPIERECTLAELFSEQRINGGQRGIGINRVLRFIDAHEGVIELYPAAQDGLLAKSANAAAVTLRLPVVANSVAPVLPNAVPRSVPPQRICLLGEEPAVLAVTRSLLEAQGHKVVTSTDPMMAMAENLHSGMAHDLLVVDVALLRRDDWELPDGAQARIAVLINSNREAVELPNLGTLGHSAAEVLTTPFSSAQLRGAIERSLEKL